MVTKDGNRLAYKKHKSRRIFIVYYHKDRYISVTAFRLFPLWMQTSLPTVLFSRSLAVRNRL